MLKLKNKKAGTAPAPDTGRRSSGSPQGITARGNALRRLASLGLLIALVPTALGFAYLILVREPAMEQRLVGRVATALASGQAAGIDRVLKQLSARLESAAGSPLALSAIASEAGEDLALVEQAMLDYFPEVVSLRIIPIGEMGTANLQGGNQGLRNHIEVDLVRRAGEGESTRPEAYQFEGKWLTSVAHRVTHPRITERRAVIIVTLDNEVLTSQLKSLDNAAGRSALQQHFTRPNGAAHTDVIAAAGSGGATDYTHHAEIPDTTWRVAFTPSIGLVNSLRADRLPLFAALALSLLGTLAALAMLASRFPRVLASEVNRVISVADKKSTLELAVPELVSLARQLRRATLRNLRQEGEPQQPAGEMGVEIATTRPEELTNPMFHTGSILDQEEEEVLELELGGEGEAETGPGFPEHIFRAYDIRGNAASELTDELVARIGAAIGTIAGEMDEQTLIVGCDGRTSSPRIKSALIRALMETGRDVVDIGLVPTPLLYFATRHLNCRSGVMVTGSHNPPLDNGLKIVLNQHTIHAGGIQQLRERMVAGDFSRGNGRMIREDVAQAYVDEVVHDIAIAVPLKIVIDAGNGATAKIAPHLFEELGCEVVPLYCDINGNFPNHPPDTSNEDNLADLTLAVEREGADFGVAFDGDGDRLAVVTGRGRIVRSDVLLMIFAQDVVSRNPGTDVVFDVKCSRNLTEVITRHGGRPVLWKTGHAFMKEKMAETGALLGGEFSGHMFFGERWYGFDDGMYAAGRLAEVLSTQGDSLDDIIDGFPATVSTPEILIPVPEEKKFGVVQEIIDGADFAEGKVNTMDGIRVDYANGWGLLRASNTSPALTARFEADSEDVLEAIKDEFRTRIGQADPDIEITF
jgi:phosphomannomutase/phosphoglucomutase